MVENIPNQMLLSILSSEDELYKAVGILLSLYIVYFLIYSRYLLSIIDPLIMAVFFSASAAFFPTYMYLNNMLYTDTYFFQFMLSEIFLFFGIVVATHNRIVLRFIPQGIIPTSKNIKVFFYICLLIYIFFLVIFFISSVNIPLAVYLSGEGSRLDANRGNIISYISAIIYNGMVLPATIMLFVLYMMNKGKTISRVQLFFCFFVLIIGSVISGSKSFLINFVFYIFFALQYDAISKDDKKIKKVRMYSVCIIVLSFLCVFIMYIFTNGSELALFGFLYRIFSSGNIFYLYAYDFFQWIDIEEYFLKWFFNGVLTNLKIIPWSDAVLNIGYQAELLYHPDSALGGPNSRHNIVGYLYFGLYGSMIFSCIIGYVIGILRNTFILASKKFDLLGYLCVVEMYRTSLTLLTGADSVPFDILVRVFDLFLAYFMYVILRKVHYD